MLSGTAILTIIISIFASSVIAQIISMINLIRRYELRNGLCKSLLQMMFHSLVLLIISFVSFFLPDGRDSQITYSISLVFYNNVIFCFYVFCKIYIRKTKMKIKNFAVVAIAMLADSVSLIVNIFTHHVIEAVPVNIGDGYVLNGYVDMPWHTMHWIISVFIMGSGLFLLVLQSTRVPRLYKRRYINVCLIAIAIFMVNVVCKLIGIGIELSALILPYSTVIIYYYTFVHSPVAFVKQTRSNMVDQMEDGIILLAYDGSFQDMNPAARRILGINPHSHEEDIQFTIYDFIERNNIDPKEPKTYNFQDPYLPSQPILRVTCTQSWEKKNSSVLVGSALRIIDRTAIVKRREEERFASTHDPLTQLLNRTAFFDTARKILLNDPDNTYYIVCTDIENFKLYNDLFGDTKGDTFLINLAIALENTLSDYAAIGRTGGDIYSVLIKKDSFSEDEFLTAFTTALSESNSSYYSVNAYIGAYEVKDPQNTPISAMCDRAAMASGSIKGFPDKFLAFYDDTLIDDILHEQELIDELKLALSEEQFIFYLQPQITRDGKVLGGEALVRWEHPTDGIVSPFKFIGVMEKHGMIADLDYAVWRKACAKLKDWRRRGIDMHISVNISPKDFYYRDIYSTFVDLVNEFGISPSKLKLEITESAVMHDQESQIELIRKLQKVGFTVEMDDFGSGYSSLNMLNTINVDVLKIDMAFLQKGVDDSRSRHIIALIQGIATALGMTTVVEGVETQEQKDFLIEAGCDVFQGYLFSPPIPVEDFERKYMRARLVK